MVDEEVFVMDGNMRYASQLRVSMMHYFYVHNNSCIGSLELS